MKVVFERYAVNDTIPVLQYLKNKKLAKYFNRETAAAIVNMGKLTREVTISQDTPFYYATGITEYEDYGLADIARHSFDEGGIFSQRLFIEHGMAVVSPLTQFKVLYNMPLCFLSIEYGLKGDNAVIYSSAKGLLLQARYAPADRDILLGAGKVYRDGKVESGFALSSKEELQDTGDIVHSDEAIEIFRYWFKGDVYI